MKEKQEILEVINIPCCIIQKRDNRVIPNKLFGQVFGISPKSVEEITEVIKGVGITEFNINSFYEKDIVILFTSDANLHELIFFNDLEDGESYLFILPKENYTFTYLKMIEDEAFQRIFTLGEMSASIVHEFKNILTAILGWLELGLNKTEDHETITLVLEVVFRNITKAKELIDTLTAFTKGEEGEIKKVNLEEIIDEVLKLVSWELKKNSIIVTKEYKNRLEIYSNPVYVYHILLNLILNSIQAMEQGGKLKLTTKELGDKEVQIIIEDTGPGIDQESLKKIFIPFFSKKRDSGLRLRGLGLTIVKRFVERIGGRIEVESSKDIGTKFYITFPLSKISTPIEPKEKSHNINLIVIDDEEEILELFSTLVAPKVKSIRLVGSYEELKELLLSGSEFFHLAIIDYTLWGVTGEDVAELLKSYFPDIKICLMTGRVELNVEGGGEEYIWIKKPFTIKEIEEIIKQVELSCFGNEEG